MRCADAPPEVTPPGPAGQPEQAGDGAADDMPSVRYRAALCRCGDSANKPFCDNSHEAADFQDYGAVGETGAANGAPVRVLFPSSIAVYGTIRVRTDGDKVIIAQKRGKKNGTRIFSSPANG